MTFRAGDIVTLKSGGQALTVAAIHDEDATCIWLGEEGDLFREQIPLIALEAILDPEDEEEEEGGQSEGEESDDEE
jgi:uncharacterized protein YodC (DUF2158 family)